MAPRVYTAIVLSLTLLATGCYAHNHIPATELPSLNQMSTQRSSAVGGAGRYNVSLVTRTVQNVRRVDGTMVQIQGAFDATVVPRDPSRTAVAFDAPVESSVDGPNLLVAGGNRPQTLFPLAQIGFIDISTYDTGLSALLGIAIGLAAGALAAGAVFLAVH